MVYRIAWSAVAAVVFILLAFVSALLEEDTYAIVFALCSITWAVLSLKEQT